MVIVCAFWLNMNLVWPQKVLPRCGPPLSQAMADMR